MFTIVFEKNDSVVLHTSYPDKYLTKTEQGYSLDELLKTTINTDMYKISKIKISECSLCTIFVEDEKFYCWGENLDKDCLIFTK